MARCLPLIFKPIPSDYSQWIKEVREIAGMTQAQFARLVGVSYASVNRWGGTAGPVPTTWLGNES